MRRLACLVLLVACGDDGSRHIMDAPLQQPDGPPGIDAAIQPVTVTFTRDGAPVADTRVYFQNADSTVAGGPMTTDATGTASAVVGVGGSVTLVDIYTPPVVPAFGGQSVRLTTWVGVKSGDHLLLADTNPPQTSMNVLIPLDPGGVNVVGSYSFYSSCSPNPSNNPARVFVAVGSGSSGSPTINGVQFTCATPDVLVVAEDTTFEPVSYFYAPAQTVVDGGVLDLTASTYVAPTSHDYHITGYAGGGQIDVIDQQASAHGLMYGHNGYASGDPIDLTVNLPAIAGGQRFIEIYDNTTANTQRHYVEWGGTIDPYSTDYSTHLLPAFTDQPTLDPATHILSWGQSGGALQTDFSVANFFIFGTNSGWGWNVVAPGPSATIQLPTVPTDLADYNYAASQSINFYGVATGKVPGGYDAIRRLVFATTGPLDLVTGASGSLAVNDMILGKVVAAKTPPTWRPRAQAPGFVRRLLSGRVR